MKLLFDQNLSPKLAADISDLFPGSKHVSELNLSCASDEDIWECARANGFTIVTKDEDFNDLSVIRGIPPKVIWLLLGNCKTSQIETILRRHFDRIITFEKEEVVGTLGLG